MKRMLINATHSEEIRVALADGQKLYNLDIDVPGQERKKGNIYKGKITRVEPSLEAAFVDYGAKRHGFLPYKEISRNYYTDAANKMKERPPIAKAVKEGTEVIIQVNKEERGNKGAAITTYISLAGRYMVYMPENPKAGGISRRIEGKARQELKDTLSKIDQPKHSGIIVRTAGIGRSVEEIDWDLNYLDQVWTAIKASAATRKAPSFLYQESDIFIRALRDYLRPDVGEILIDNKEIFEKARDFMQQVMPHNLKKLSYYNDTIPLFSRYQIESQIQSAFSREVHLPSGGSLVIDHTEAMISIDINSARATKGADIEETATNTNLEAADEIARQLRIRDLGGLVVIDFIDMRNHKNQKAVEQQLNEAVSNDRARIQTSKISKFGLLEMSRQRLKSSINESSQFVCPRCSGHGFIRNIESLSVSILRILEEESLKPDSGKVIAQVPTKVANFIINEKREELNNLESRHSVPIFIVGNEFYQTPQFDIKRLKKSEASNFDVNSIALNKPASEEEAENKSSQALHQNRQVAAVDVLVPHSQVPIREEDKNKFTGWLKSLFTSNSNSDEKQKPKKAQTHKKPQHSHKKASQASKNQQHKKPQQNKQQNKKPQQNKQSANKQSANNQGKNKQQQNKKPQHNKQQQNKQNKQNQNKGTQRPQKPQQQKQKQDQNQQVVKNQTSKNNDAVETPKTNEQMLQRPLGSVASYAANKAKQETGTDKTQKQVETKQVNKDVSQIKETTSSSHASEPKSNEAKDQNKDNSVKTNENKKSQTVKSDKDEKGVTTKPDTIKTAEKQVKEKPASTQDTQIEPISKTEKAMRAKSEKTKDNTTKAQAESKPKAEPKAQAESKPKAEPKAQAESKSKAEPKAQAESKSKAESKAQAESKPKAEPKVQAESKPKAEPKAQAESKPKAEPKAQAESKPKAEPKAQAESKPKAEPKAQAESKPKAEPKAQAEAKVKTNDDKSTDKAQGKSNPIADKKPEIVQKPKPVAKPKKKMPDPTSGIDFDI